MIKEIEQDPILNHITIPESQRKGLRYGRYRIINMNINGCVENAYKIIVKKVWQ